MLAALADDPELRLDMNFMPGDIQFLHNHTILHARSAYEDWPEVERKRHLLRLWLAPAGRPAAAAGICRMLRRPDDRRSRRHHLPGNPSARTACSRAEPAVLSPGRWVNHSRDTRRCARTSSHRHRRRKRLDSRITVSSLVPPQRRTGTSCHHGARRKNPRGPFWSGTPEVLRWASDTKPRLPVSPLHCSRSASCRMN